MSNISIILEPYRAYYYPGDNITGHVLVTLSSQKKVNEIRLEANGRAHVVFWHGHGDDRHSYTGEKVYLRGEMILWRKNKAKGEKYLPGGTKQYPFSLTVPYDAAPSMEGTHGHIRYKLKAKLDLPWSLDINYEKEIKIASPINLSSTPLCIQPHIAHINKSGAFVTNTSLQASVSVLKYCKINYVIFFRSLCLV